MLFNNKRYISSKVKIKFNQENEIDYPPNIRIPNVGEYMWFGVFKQGTVSNIENRLEDNNFITIIYVNE